VIVVGPFVDYQVSFQQDAPNGVLGQHSLNGSKDYLFRVFRDQVLHQDFFQAARVACIMTVEFLIHLVSSCSYLGSVHNDALIANIKSILFVGWLVLSSDIDGDHLCHASERDLLGVEQVPRLTSVVDCNVRGLRFLLRLDALDVSVKKMVGHLHDSMADVRIKFKLGVFWLWFEALCCDNRLILLRNGVLLVTLQES